MSVYKDKNTSKKAPEEQEAVEPEVIETPEIDALLDEIDDVLEENAQEFVEQYVQKGGQ